MKLLVTGGNTTIPVDRVRVITNIFTGRTGAAIARCAHDRGHDVTLLMSRPESLGDLIPQQPVDRWRTLRFETFDDLLSAMEREMGSGAPDAIIHSAAVSDYRVAGHYVPAPGVHACTVEDDLEWTSCSGIPRLISVSAGKVKSDAEELWLRLVPTPKVVDRIRSDWEFRGVLVKFKLEVDLDESELLTIAERSRLHSGADLMVANLLETAAHRAYVGPTSEGYRVVSRRELPECLLQLVEAIAAQEPATT